MSNKKPSEKFIDLLFKSGLTENSLEEVLTPKRADRKIEIAAEIYSLFVKNNLLKESRFELIEEILLENESVGFDEFMQNTGLARQEPTYGYRHGEKTLLQSMKRVPVGKLRVYKQLHDIHLGDFYRLTKTNNEEIMGSAGLMLFYKKSEAGTRREIIMSPKRSTLYCLLNQRSMTRDYIDMMNRPGRIFYPVQNDQDTFFVSFVREKNDE